MSYTFRVEASPFDPADLTTVGASYRAIRGAKQVAWLAWRGEAARGVTIIDTGTATECVLRSFSSEDDVALAVELSSLIAARANTTINAEEVPPDCEGSFDAVTPQQLARWPKHWFAYQSFASVAHFVELGLHGQMLLSTPGRRAWLTPSLLKTLGYVTKSGREIAELSRHRRDVDYQSFVSATQPLVEYLQWARPLLQLPTRPLYTTPQLPVPKRLLFLTLHDRAPFTFLEAEAPLFGDFNAIDGVPELATHTTLVAEERASVVMADYATFEDEDGWAAVPFDAVLKALGPVERIDQHSIVFPKLSLDEWPAFTAKLKPSRVGTLASDDSYRLTSRVQLLEKYEQFRFSQAERDELRAWDEAKKQGDDAEQDRRIDRLLQLGPDRADAWYWRGVQRYRQGRHAEARIALETANTREYIDGRFAAEARNDLALLLGELGDVAAARDALGFAISHTPSDEDRARYREHRAKYR